MRSSAARAAGLFVGLALVSSAGAARGEFWASSLRDLLREARSVEEVTVTAVRPDGQWTVRVEDSLRGRPAGTVGSVQPFWLSGPSVAPGGRALVICDASQCPRAVGVERAGAWVLSAQEPGDGAAVMPTIVERRAWRDIAAGRPVPPLCINVTLGFVDEPNATEALRVSLAADTGGGTATGAVLGSAVTTAQASLGSRNDSIELALSTARGNVLVEAHGLAAGLTRAPDGCLAVRGDVERPFARTRAELRSNLATGNRSVTLGRGVLHCADERALPYCGTQVRLVANDGNLALAVSGSPVINVHSMQTLPRTNLLRVGFMLGDGGSGPLLTLDVPAPAQANPSLFFTLASALRASAGGRASFPVHVRAHPEGGERPLGSIEFVREGP